MNDFDCIIIGSGIGGLTAAGRLASKGIKVLLLEKNPRAGGYLQSFKRKGVVFDSSIDCFSGLDEHGPISILLRSLEVDNEIEFIRVDPIRTSIFPGITVHVHAEIDLYIEELKRLFPREAPGIEKLFGVLGAIYDDIRAWADSVTGLKRDERMPGNIIKYSDATYSELLDCHISDPSLKAILSDRCPFYGLPPGKVSAVAMTALIMSYFDSGAYRVRGGSQGLADVIVKGIRKKGGRVLFNKEVVEILTDGDTATGVKTADGEEYTSKCVLSSLDFLKTYRDLIGAGKNVSERALSQPLPRVSSSFFILYAAAELDLSGLGASSSIGIYPTFDMESNFTPSASFHPETTTGLTIPTILDPSMAPKGLHSVTAHEMVDASYTDSWSEAKDRLTERLLAKVEKVLPGLKESSIHIEAATPATLERYTGNTGGAAYGWMQVPGLRPLKTFMGNLHFAGHWEGIGGGVVAAAYSGLRAANRVAERL